MAAGDVVVGLAANVTVEGAGGVIAEGLTASGVVVGQAAGGVVGGQAGGGVVVGQATSGVVVG